jgi:tetratricopeptide (TPR) repeat protein
MKLSHAGIGIFLLAILVAASGCGYINGIRAKSQLNEAVSAYKDKKYDEAEKYTRKALELDPTNENAPLILAVTLQTQYRRGDTSEPNVKRAQEAIDLYKQVEAKDPNNDQAFTAVTILLGYLNKPDEQRAWLEKRANDAAVSATRRSDAYAFLANKDWECSIEITDKNKQNVSKPDGSVTIQYKKPQDAGEYDKALKCMTHGLEMAETAISMNADSETAWGQKYNLLREAAKLAKMDENEDKASQYEKQALEALKRTQDLHERNKATETPEQPAS